jgi:hypothetical protein
MGRWPLGDRPMGGFGWLDDRLCHCGTMNLERNWRTQQFPAWMYAKQRFLFGKKKI